MINFSTLQGLSIPEGNVTKIEDAAGNMLWSAVEEVIEVPTDCIVFVGKSSNFTLTATYVEWDGTVEYSTDKTSWAVWDGSAIFSARKKLYLRGYNNTTFYTSRGAELSLSGKAACLGNINTLLEYNNPPSTLADSCYYAMFANCTNLTQAPELPATTLAESCYGYMFSACTNLTQAPALPATTLADYCYEAIFYGCTNLTQVPELPATTLYDFCYIQMFACCNKIKLSSTQTDEYTQPYRIPTSGTGTTRNYALSNMFTSTGGTFTGTPEINTTYYLHKDNIIV